MARRSWIAGASGLVGGCCLRRLLACPEYAEVHAFVRESLEVEEPKLQQHRIPLDQVAGADLPPPDDLFCAVGTTLRKAGSKEAFRRVDYELVLQLARAAVVRGAKRLVLVTSVASAPGSPNYYLHVKGELEAELALLPFETVVFLRPSFLIGNRAELRLGERVAIPLARAFRFLLFGPMRIYRAIPADDVAAGMVGAALHAAPGRHILHYDEILGYARR